MILSDQMEKEMGDISPRAGIFRRPTLLEDENFAGENPDKKVGDQNKKVVDLEKKIGHKNELQSSEKTNRIAGAISIAMGNSEKQSAGLMKFLMHHPRKMRARARCNRIIAFFRIQDVEVLYFLLLKFGVISIFAILFYGIYVSLLREYLEKENLFFPALVNLYDWEPDPHVSNAKVVSLSLRITNLLHFGVVAKILWVSRYHIIPVIRVITINYVYVVPFNLIEEPKIEENTQSNLDNPWQCANAPLNEAENRTENAASSGSKNAGISDNDGASAGEKGDPDAKKSIDKKELRDTTGPRVEKTTVEKTQEIQNPLSDNSDGNGNGNARSDASSMEESARHLQNMGLAGRSGSGLKDILDTLGNAASSVVSSEEKSDKDVHDSKSALDNPAAELSHEPDAVNAVKDDADSDVNVLEGGAEPVEENSASRLMFQIGLLNVRRLRKKFLDPIVMWMHLRFALILLSLPGARTSVVLFDGKVVHNIPHIAVICSNAITCLAMVPLMNWRVVRRNLIQEGNWSRRVVFLMLMFNMVSFIMVPPNDILPRMPSLASQLGLFGSIVVSAVHSIAEKMRRKRNPTKAATELPWDMTLLFLFNLSFAMYDDCIVIVVNKFSNPGTYWYYVSWYIVGIVLQTFWKFLLKEAFLQTHASFTILQIFGLQLFYSMMSAYQIFKMPVHRPRFYVSILTTCIFEVYRDTRFRWELDTSGKDWLVIFLWNVQNGIADVVGILILMVIVVCEFLYKKQFTVYPEFFAVTGWNPDAETDLLDNIMGNAKDEGCVLERAMTDSEYFYQFSGLVGFLLVTFFQVVFCEAWNRKRMRQHVLAMLRKNPEGREAIEKQLDEEERARWRRRGRGDGDEDHVQEVSCIAGGEAGERNCEQQLQHGKKSNEETNNCNSENAERGAECGKRVNQFLIPPFIVEEGQSCGNACDLSDIATPRSEALLEVRGWHDERLRGSRTSSRNTDSRRPSAELRSNDVSRSPSVDIARRLSMRNWGKPAPSRDSSIAVPMAEEADMWRARASEAFKALDKPREFVNFMETRGELDILSSEPLQNNCRPFERRTPFGSSSNHPVKQQPIRSEKKKWTHHLIPPDWFRRDNSKKRMADAWVSKDDSESHYSSGSSDVRTAHFGNGDTISQISQGSKRGSIASTARFGTGSVCGQSNSSSSYNVSSNKGENGDDVTLYGGHNAISNYGSQNGREHAEFHVELSNFTKVVSAVDKQSSDRNTLSKGCTEVTPSNGNGEWRIMKDAKLGAVSEADSGFRRKINIAGTVQPRRAGRSNTRKQTLMKDGCDPIAQKLAKKMDAILFSQPPSTASDALQNAKHDETACGVAAGGVGLQWGMSKGAGSASNQLGMMNNPVGRSHRVGTVNSAANLAARIANSDKREFQNVNPEKSTDPINVRSTIALSNPVGCGHLSVEDVAQKYLDEFQIHVACVDAVSRRAMIRRKTLDSTRSQKRNRKQNSLPELAPKQDEDIGPGTGEQSCSKNTVGSESIAKTSSAGSRETPDTEVGKSIDSEIYSAGGEVTIPVPGTVPISIPLPSDIPFAENVSETDNISDLTITDDADIEEIDNAMLSRVTRQHFVGHMFFFICAAIDAISRGFFFMSVERKRMQNPYYMYSDSTVCGGDSSGGGRLLTEMGGTIPFETEIVDKQESLDFFSSQYWV